MNENDMRRHNTPSNNQQKRAPSADVATRTQNFQNKARADERSGERPIKTQNVQNQEKNALSGRKISPKLKIVVALAAIALIFVACMVANIAIGVREIEVEGLRLCTREEILEAAGIEEGSGYFSYNASKAEKRIAELYPCVIDVNVSRSTFGKVTVSVTEKNALWYVESYGEYFALSDELEVIKNSESRERFINCGLVRLDFPEIKSAVLGKPIEIRDGDRDCAYVSELLDDVSNTNIYKSGRLYQIQIKTKFEVFMVVDREYLVSIGNCTNVEGKLGLLEKALADARFDGNETWEIIVSDTSNPTARKNAELDFSYLYP